MKVKVIDKLACLTTLILKGIDMKPLLSETLNSWRSFLVLIMKSEFE